MDLITAEEVIRRIKLYFDGGAISYLDKEQRLSLDNSSSGMDR
jgi:hypothetical protein